MSGCKAINRRMTSAVSEGKLEQVRELIDSFGLSYSPAWSGGYVLLRDALRNSHTSVAKLLLERGSMVKMKSGKPSNTPLHLAVKHSDIEIVKMILEKGASINAKNQSGDTPLHSAIKNKKIEATEILLKRGADGNARDRNGLYLLHIAVQKGCFQMVKHLLEYGASVSCVCTSKPKDGYTPLHFAAEIGDKEIIALLISKGAKVDERDVDKITPLHIAAIRGYVEAAEELLNHGAGINSSTLKKMYTPLHFACDDEIVKPFLNKEARPYENPTPLSTATREGRAAVVNLLLQHGAKAKDPRLLRSAVEKGYLKIVEQLLKCGVDANMRLKITSITYSTPLQIAVENRHEEITRLLISHEADINAKNADGLIYCAIKNADCKITELLLTRGANVRDRPELLNRALHYVASSKDFTMKGEMAKLLLERGAHADAPNFGTFRESYTTPLHAATEQGNAKVVEALLEYNANVDAKMKDGSTALHIAAGKGFHDIVKALLGWGAKNDHEIENDNQSSHLGDMQNRQEFFGMSLKFAADINSRDNYGRTALHWASMNGHLKIVETLLKCGAEINIRTCKTNETPLDSAVNGEARYRMRRIAGSDEYNRIANSYGVIADFLRRHIIKLSTANLCEVKLIQSLNPVGSDFDSFSDECEIEIAIMKCEKIIDTNISFYDILAADTKSLAKYMSNENILLAMESGVYAVEFPIYASMIGCQFRKGMRRKLLLEQGNEIFRRIEYVPELPHDCIENIFSYLSDEDLKIFMLAGIIPDTAPFSTDPEDWPSLIKYVALPSKAPDSWADVLRRQK